MENRWKGMMDDMFNPEEQPNNLVSFNVDMDDEPMLVSIFIPYGDKELTVNMIVKEYERMQMLEVLNYNKIGYRVQPIMFDHLG